MSTAETDYILAVDDTPASLRLLTDILNAEGYQVRSAINGELALSAAAIQAPQLVLLDINMPVINGFEVCQRLKQDPRLRDVPVIFVSAFSEMPDKLKGFASGGVDYVTKPFQREELLARVRTHLELHRLRHHLEEKIDERTRLLRESESRLRNNLLETVSAVSVMVEMRDLYTAGHQRRVQQMAGAIAKIMNLPHRQIEGLTLAAVVHDVGKFQVPSEILNRPGPLSDIEFSLIKQHSEMGYKILKSINFPWPIAEMVFQHHERLDRSGYPQGLGGEEILLEARIIAVADVIEAMASHRPYRPALGFDTALEEIEKNRGKLYDPVVTDAALTLFRKNGFKLDD